MEKQRQTGTYEIPRWAATALAVVVLGLVGLCAWGMIPRPAPTIAAAPTETSNGEVRDEAVASQHLSGGPVVALLSHGDRLWVGSDLDGLSTLAGVGLAAEYPGAQVFALLTDGEGVLAGYVAFQDQAPVAEIEGEGGILLSFDEPAFVPGEGEAGLARWDGEAWTTLWPSEHGVWGLARAGDEGLYLSTNDGVYLLKGRQAWRLGLEGTLCFGLLRQDALYVGALGGIWRYDGGNWSHVLHLPGHKALAFAHAADRFYAATTAGLFTSADGLSWVQRGEALSLEAVAVAPDGRVYVGGEGGVYTVGDGGLEALVAFPCAHALAWHETALYVGAGDGLWRISLQQQEAMFP